LDEYIYCAQGINPAQIYTKSQYEGCLDLNLPKDCPADENFQTCNASLTDLNNCLANSESCKVWNEYYSETGINDKIRIGYIQNCLDECQPVIQNSRNVFVQVYIWNSYQTCASTGEGPQTIPFVKEPKNKKEFFECSAQCNCQ
jgi:hypothetical protein